MNLGPHAGFIVACYVLALVVIAALIGWIVWDNRTQRRQLAKLEAQGVARRSEKTA